MLYFKKKIKKNIVIVIHCNHPNELDLQVKSCLKKLKNCDVTLFNQSVLLKDINDNLESLKILSEQLFSCGVIPYYIHILDQVNGAESFSVSLKKAKVLRSKLTNSLPNYLVPKFVREIPESKKFRFSRAFMRFNFSLFSPSEIDLFSLYFHKNLLGLPPENQWSFCTLKIYSQRLFIFKIVVNAIFFLYL